MSDLQMPSGVFNDLRVPLLGDRSFLNKVVAVAVPLFFCSVLTPSLLSQNLCRVGVRLEGSVSDPTGAIVPGAHVQTNQGLTVISDGSGHYVLPCVPAGSVSLTVQAAGFETKTEEVATVEGQVAHTDFHLTVTTVKTEIRVTADAIGLDRDQSSSSLTLRKEDVQQLSDDPDDFLHQLQMLAASGGGSPESATIAVDGFQNGSAMPPKSSIASIRINPDPFSAVYETPPWSGGRVEIFTKPGAAMFHGALFLSDSDSSFNANDPFSTVATPASNRRYGFELSGPILPKKSDFSIAFEKRYIGEFNVVNAVTLDASDSQTPLRETVSAPQQLWIASARGGWQVTPDDVSTLSYSANVNSLVNQGVGGLTLLEAGYASRISEFDLRFTNSQTIGATLLHETRIGFTWKRTEQTPNSTSPSLQVAGYFLGGGATSQNLNNRERDLELDDDIMLTQGKHTIKVGLQSIGFLVHDFDPDTFNGSSVFGGGSAPVLDANNTATGQTTTISALEQYSRALQGLPGGASTTYQINTGTPLVPLIQWRIALYAEDTIKPIPRLSLIAGMRYALQTSPNTFANVSPRLGLSWSPDKKARWVIQARTGLFSTAIAQTYPTEVDRLNGVRQKETLVYSPNYRNPLTPVAGSIQIGTVWQFPHAFEQPPSGDVQVSVEHEFPHHWMASVSYTLGDDWGILRSLNINAPLVSSTAGVAPNPTAALSAARPIAPNENIMQYQNSGHSLGFVYSASLRQSSYKRFVFGMGFFYSEFRSNGSWSGAAIPQSTYSNQGEFSRPDTLSNGAYLYDQINLPKKIELASQLFVQYGTPYNITTGTDANGDGTFNDRPSYAVAPGAGVYSTHFGLLTANTINGNVPRNLGTMPAMVDSYVNLSRTFQLNPKDHEHPRSLSLNARAANVLNHTNVTAVETVLSPTLGEPLTAATARRVELGSRFTF